MTNGNKPADGGHLILDLDEAIRVRASDVRAAAFIRRFVGGDESIKGSQRFCLWIQDKDKDLAAQIPAIAERLERVKTMRAKSPKKLTQDGVKTPHAFQQIRQDGNEVLQIGRASCRERV